MNENKKNNEETIFLLCDVSDIIPKNDEFEIEFNFDDNYYIKREIDDYSQDEILYNIFESYFNDMFDEINDVGVNEDKIFNDFLNNERTKHTIEIQKKIDSFNAGNDLAMLCEDEINSLK
jgi:hypothetical protein